MLNEISFSTKIKYVLKFTLSLCIIFSVLMCSACGNSHFNNSALSLNSSDSLDLLNSSDSLNSLDLSDNTTSEDFITFSSEIASTDSNSSDCTTSNSTASTISTASTSIIESIPPTTPQVVPVADESFLSGVWISFYDYRIKGMNKSQFTARIEEMFDNVKEMSIKNVFCHVRAHADAYYPSTLFPFSADISGTQGVDPGYDPMAIMIQEAHARDLKFHAWINPYRISTKTDDVNTLAENNPARIWANDEDSSNDRYYVVWNGGLFFNPTCPVVQKLIIDGVKEIIDKYQVDGIHLDDYFYPTSDKAFDSAEYAEYSSKTIYPMSLGDWRRAHVNSLIQGIYRATSAKEIPFGISPSAHISADHSDTNYTQQFADITLWMSTPGYVDYIAPQIYFGYNYPVDKYKFSYLLDLWTSLERSSSVKMYIGLAGYKITDNTADCGSMEWSTSNDILSRQTNDSYSKGTDGVILFSYSSMVSEDKLNKTQMLKLKNTLTSIN